MATSGAKEVTDNSLDECNTFEWLDMSKGKGDSNANRLSSILRLLRLRRHMEKTMEARNMPTHTPPIVNFEVKSEDGDPAATVVTFALSVECATVIPNVDVTDSREGVLLEVTGDNDAGGSAKISVIVEVSSVWLKTTGNGVAEVPGKARLEVVAVPLSNVDTVSSGSVI